MAKKCIPGVICVENITLFFLFVILVLVLYLWYSQTKKNEHPSKIVVVNHQPPMAPSQALASISARNDPFNHFAK